MSDTQETTTVQTIEPDATINIQTGVPAEAPVAVEPTPTPEPEVPAKKTWYLTKTVDGLMMFDKSVELGATEAQPANSTPWAPPTILGTGLAVYWDGSAWQGGTDLTTASIDTLKAIALKRANFDFMEAVDNLSIGYTPAEQQSWKQQVIDANAVIAGQPASHLLTTLATVRNMAVADLAKSIVAKSQAYNDQYATILANFQKLRDSITVASDATGLPAFTIDDIHLG